MRGFLIVFGCALTLAAYEKNVTLSVQGMSCPTCTRAVKLSLQSVDGVKEAKVYLNGEKAIVTLQKETPISALYEAVKKVGYTAKLQEILTR